MLRRLVCNLISSAVLLAFAGGASVVWAQQPAAKSPTIPFLKTKVTPLSGTYLVLKDANVRIRPATKGRRIGRRGKGDKVTVVGRAKGPWLAIRGDDGKDIGFIYQSTLMPVIDGTLEKPLSGTVRGGGDTTCRYEIHFDGKSPAQGQAFEFADYEVRWRCTIGGKEAQFHTPMFLTEGPYRGRTKRIHQITIDILDLTVSLEDVLSTNTLWDRNKGTISFDSVTVKQFSRNPTRDSEAAANLAEALNGAVQIASSAWNTPLWRALAEKSAAAAN